MSNTVTAIDAESRPTQFTSARHRLKALARFLSQFLAGQASLQAVNAATGLLLLRWLSITAYAQYSVAFGFQSMITVFVDLGFSGCIVALVGERGHDKEVVGKYISSAQHFRRRMYLVVAIASLIIFPMLTFKQHWGATTTILLLSTILGAVFFQSWGMYMAPLLINRRLKDVYTPQLISGFGRTALYLLLHIAGALSAWTVTMASAITLAYNGLSYRRSSKPYAQLRDHSDPEYNREMIRYLSPLIPGIIFTALQGQIALVAITVFGHTRSIADVAALGRLVQLFLLLFAFNTMIIEPFMARVAQKDLHRRYLQILFVSIIIATVIYMDARCFPGPLLWLLGPKYRDLKDQIPLIVLISCVSYISSVLWTMHSARRWIYWWGSIFYIALSTAVQIICAMTMHLNTTTSVLHFSLATAIVVLFVQVVNGIYGLIYGAPHERDRVVKQLT